MDIKFNKEDLIEKIAKNTGSTKVQAEREIKNVLEGIESCLCELSQATGTGESKFQILNYFTITIKHVAEHMGKNPKTNEPLKVAESNRIKIKAGKALKDAVN